ncbi:MAG: signal recognition particle protein, partial [Pannonibacter indicus]
PRRIADRILGMGDIVSLVEKAAEAIDAEKAAKMAAKLQKGNFDLEDLADQLKQMEKLGGMSGMMSMLPGISKFKKQMDAANIDERMFKRQIAIIQSMTPVERRKPDILKASRKKRIASGSGVDVSEVNKLLKMHRQMADVMKMMGKNKGMLGKMMGALGGSMAGGMPNIDPKQLEELAKSGKIPGAGDLLKGLPDGGAGGLPGGLPPGMGGLPKLPGLGGLGGMGGFPGLGGKGKKR